MFLADRLVYLELQKTGGSHIDRLLESCVDGKTAGKHHRIITDMSEKFIIGSIRNPWDWYVSLWAFGCGGKGSIRNRTARHLDFAYYNHGLPEAMGKKKLSLSELSSAAYHDLIKPVSQWQKTYSDSTDAECFRRWLKLLLDEKHRFDIGEGYGFSSISSSSGLLSYRYFRLFTLGDSVFIDNSLRSNSGLAEFDQAFNITSGVIRMENLEDDFIRLLAEAGEILSESQCESIRNKDAGKTNASSRKSAAYYYDDETLALVAEKESYLIDKYDYSVPVTG